MEQFDSLKNRQIQEPIGITQEILHTIKKIKFEALVLKLNLRKTFDRVNWNFIRLILLQINMSLGTVNWIMGCVSSTNFLVLINGPLSSFLMPHMVSDKVVPYLPSSSCCSSKGLVDLLEQPSNREY